MKAIIWTPPGFVGAFDLTLTRICGDDPLCGLWLTQHNYWSAVEGDQGGWICKTAQEWQARTCLTRRQQERIRSYLNDACLIETELRGLPAKLHTRLMVGAIQNRVIELWGNDFSPDFTQVNQVDTEGENKFRQKGETGFDEKGNHYKERADLKFLRKDKEFKKENTPYNPPSGDGHTEGEIKIDGRKTKRPKADDAIEYSETFKQFWERYPRKTAKATAYDVWQRDHCDHIVDAILGAMANHEDFKREKEFIPHPATWLRQRRWEDEAPAKKAYTSIRELGSRSSETIGNE